METWIITPPRPALLASPGGVGAHTVLRLAVILAAIAALLWQSFLVQTHIHYPDCSVQAASRVQPALAVARAGHPGDAPADCPLCREQVQAAAYLTPVLPLVVVPVSAYVLLAELPITASVLVAFAPAWLARAPPLPPCA